MAQKQLQLQENTLEVSSTNSRSSSNDGKRQRRGTLWVIGSFALCPYHLPITLGLLVALFGGTALGALVVHYSLIAGTITTLLWAAGTWYGFRQLRARQTCAI
ncbi:MAG: hypothetical protein H0U76_06700 [Ktedonobacteraceae bacterium]|nr:hypothetical protein [Ktedonobacteraceae bacterium]